MTLAAALVLALAEAHTFHLKCPGLDVEGFELATGPTSIHSQDGSREYDEVDCSSGFPCDDEDEVAIFMPKGKTMVTIISNVPIAPVSNLKADFVNPSYRYEVPIKATTTTTLSFPVVSPTTNGIFDDDWFVFRIRYTATEEDAKNANTGLPTLDGTLPVILSLCCGCAGGAAEEEPFLETAECCSGQE